VAVVVVAVVVDAVAVALVAAAVVVVDVAATLLQPQQPQQPEPRQQLVVPKVDAAVPRRRLPRQQQHLQAGQPRQQQLAVRVDAVDVAAVVAVALATRLVRLPTRMLRSLLLLRLRSGPFTWKVQPGTASST
jgi:hypothetical protein